MKNKIVILTIIISLFINISITYAGPTFDIEDAIGGADTFLGDGQSAASGVNIDGPMSNVVKGIVSAGLGIGTIVAVCAGIVIAIKNMTDGAYGKKELKESLTPYIIGCVVLFSAFTIWSGTVEIMENTIAPAGSLGGDTETLEEDTETLEGDHGTLLGGENTYSDYKSVLLQGELVAPNIYKFYNNTEEGKNLIILLDMFEAGGRPIESFQKSEEPEYIYYYKDNG